MRKITVEYILTDEEESRLKKITEAYRKRGSNWSEDEIFDFIMTMDGTNDIAQKFGLQELHLDIAQE